MPKILRILNRLNIGGPTLNVTNLSAYLPSKYQTKVLAGFKEEEEGSSEYWWEEKEVEEGKDMIIRSTLLLFSSLLIFITVTAPPLLYYIVYLSFTILITSVFFRFFFSLRLFCLSFYL